MRDDKSETEGKDDRRRKTELQRLVRRVKLQLESNLPTDGEIPTLPSLF